MAYKTLISNFTQKLLLIFAPMSLETGEIAAQNLITAVVIHTSEKSTSEILQIGTAFGTLES